MLTTLVEKQIGGTAKPRWRCILRGDVSASTTGTVIPVDGGWTAL